MTPVAAYLRPPPNSGSGSTAKPSPAPGCLTRKLIHELFAAFTLVWPEHMPKRLASVPRDEHADQWLQALTDAQLTEAQIYAGFERARNGSDYAPTIAAFLRFCQDHASDEQRALYGAMQAADAERKALTHGTWEDRRSAGKRAIAGLRAALVEQPTPCPSPTAPTHCPPTPANPPPRDLP